MELIKKSERGLKASLMLKTFRSMGGKTKQVGEFKKWKELPDGRISVSMNVYEIEGVDEMKCYLLEDTLGRVCAPLTYDKAEVLGWLKEHGYKTVHDFYIQDCGMTEETWKVWNSEEE